MDFHIPDAIAVLERTPRTLQALLEGLAPPWTDANEGADTWSPHIIVGHLMYLDVHRLYVGAGGDGPERRGILGDGDVP